jgi:hypothetical protein
MIWGLLSYEREGIRMTRYWVSWWSGYYLDEGCTKPPFQSWISGQRDGPRDECSFCAVIDADSESEILDCIRHHFPDYELRFCNPKPDDYEPGDRFPGFCL